MGFRLCKVGPSRVKNRIDYASRFLLQWLAPGALCGWASSPLLVLLGMLFGVGPLEVLEQLPFHVHPQKKKYTHATRAAYRVEEARQVSAAHEVHHIIQHGLCRAPHVDEQEVDRPVVCQWEG